APCSVYLFDIPSASHRTQGYFSPSSDHLNKLPDNIQCSLKAGYQTWGPSCNGVCCRWCLWSTSPTE
ncbi:unnamed protein product, partial [Ascophyllum nodosum]